MILFCHSLRIMSGIFSSLEEMIVKIQISSDANRLEYFFIFYVF